MIKMDSSPNNSTPNSSHAKSSGFSPVLVNESPVSKTSQCGNLTGLPRIIRDNAAELFNVIQEWNRNQLSSISMLNELVALKISSLSESEPTKKKSYPEGITPLLESLDEIYKKQIAIVERMKAISKEMQSVSKLHHHHDKNRTPLFLTWSSDKFGETVDIVRAAYVMELQLKQFIMENIAHSDCKTEVKFFSAAWVHQPYIDELINLKLEAMLKETGHR